MCSRFWISVLLGLVLSAISHTSAQDYRVICGRRKVKSVYLIRNGLDAKPGHWPWHAAIYYKDTTKPQGIDYKCGGSIIDDNTILTAAHCVFTTGPVRASKLSIHVGRIHVTEDAEYTQKLNAKDVILHPSFSGTKIDNDIALIKLATNITMTKFVQPVCLWNKDDSTEVGKIVGKNGTIVGFGFTEVKAVSSTLKQTLVGVVDSLTCIESNREVFGNQLTANMICARGQEGASACSGDSGGGMFFEIEGKWYVRGIVSFIPQLSVDGLCDSSSYTAFTDVTKYIDWITKYIDPEILPLSRDVIEVDYDEKLQLFNLNTCGITTNAVIAEGARWTLPWLGYVGIYKSSNDSIDKRCVVTLLNEWYAVGPAHCFQNDGLERRVLFGGNTELTQPNCDNRRNKGSCESPTQMLQIQRIIIHPMYSINNTADNIALIEMLNPADTTQLNVRPICIPIVPKLRSNTTTDLTIAAQTSSPKSFISKPVNYVDSEVCGSKYLKQGFPLFLASKRLCTQIINRAAQDCIQLKTGAPLQQLRRFNGKRQYFLRGFDIFGRSCSTSLPSVYSNINTFLDWILYNMRPNVVEKPEETTNAEDAAIVDSWNQLQQEPDQKKLSLFNLDTCGVTTVNFDKGDDRPFYPWMGLLVTHKNTMEPLTYIESAVVLISDRYAIAPAHIVSNSVSWRFVVLGYCNALLLVSCANAPCDHLFKKVEIKNILIHPSYAGDPKRHNIALIEFMKPADLQHRYIKPICLPLTKELRKSKPLELTVIPFRNYDNEIRNLTLMLPTSCQERFGQEGFVTTLKAAPLCAQETTVSKDRVTLKSGAMLQTSSRIDGQDRYFLRGINILNDTFEKTYQYLPYAFTNTDLYLDWILDNMNDESQESIASNDLVERLSVDSGAVSLPSVRQRFKKKLVNLNTCGVYPKVEQATNKLYSPWLGYVTAHPDPKDLLCMVILISEWYTVGPVHTIINRTDIKVQLGSMIDSSDVECEEGDESTLCDPELQRIPTTRMIVHPHFNPSDYSNDIMLLQLSRSVRKPQINPICLPVDDQIRSYDIANVRGHAFNLVSLNFVAKKLDEHTYIPSSECQKRWNQLALNWQLENVTQCVVAQFSPNTECLTTLPGFPVYTLQNINGRDRLFLRGFAKAWPHFCSKYYPVIYTNIDTYSDWILQNMDASLDYQQLSFDLHKELLFT
ncbi:uncharacterized protein LOC118507748 isoform X1 [Anopheles stephensi]|uniref:uncharacterized protein LOC118507748 isoform X1 n=1 Tax=Anopheles stephensi TaxID=30069 RepID=UPI0016587AAC|nr:uncharacterized protein LOC118507748 isoform X1 [Anopheles stephensi]